MKKRFIFVIVAVLIFIPAIFAQVKKDGLDLSQQDMLGLDKVYDFDLPQLTKTPNGYEPIFIEHYGRHGSRYAYDLSYYSYLKLALDTAGAHDVLTPFGQDIAARYAVHYPVYLLRIGDLTPLGIEQNKRIAAMMYDNFSKVFTKNAKVCAVSSNSSRSMMSMTAFCISLQSKAPYLDIVARNGNEFLPATCPRDSHNPWPCTRVPREYPFEESLNDFQDRKFGDPDVILSRLFTDVDLACGGMEKRDFVRRLYSLVAGMASLPENERTDFTGLFMEDECAKMVVVLNYMRFLKHYKYFELNQQVARDIVRDADARIAAKERGAMLRFGHDHVVMPLCEIMGIEGAESVPQSADEVVNHFQIWHSPMATNLQLIFYLKKGSDDVLFKLLRNGREAHLAIPAVNWPYYSWDEYKRWLLSKNILL